mmetsp:Transcript_40017/g.125724  ORF Transcript_40017/g.125724 Transcript_40017/m.125724 type:complete len:139 (-) Transcript_40017:9-425(-)
MPGLQGLVNEVPARRSGLLLWLPHEGLGDTSQLHILEEQLSEAFDDDDATRSSDTPNKVEEGSLTSRVFLPTFCLEARVCDNKEVSGVEACESMDDDEDWSMHVRERLDEDKEEDEESKEEGEEEIVEKRVPIPGTTK